VNVKEKKVGFTYKLSQKKNNKQVLHYMKKNLGVGSVREDKRGMAHYLIRDRESIKRVLIPLFDENTLLTSKEDSYKKFKQCL
jgi:hypothetical protein